MHTLLTCQNTNMKKKRKHYDFYVQCMKTGWLPNKFNAYVTGFNSSVTGLCGAAHCFQIDEQLLFLLTPTHEDELRLQENGFGTGWWGYEGDIPEWADIPEQQYAFTTLRQTIVLFMACLAGEKF